MTDSERRQACPDSTANTHSAAVDALKAMLQPCAGQERPRMRDLAKRLGLNAGYLSQIVHGKRAPV